VLLWTCIICGPAAPGRLPSWPPPPLPPPRAVLENLSGLGLAARSASVNSVARAIRGRAGRSVSEEGPLLERLGRAPIRSGIEKRHGAAGPSLWWKAGLTPSP